MRSTIHYPNRAFSVDGLAAVTMKITSYARNFGKPEAPRLHTWVGVDIKGTEGKSVDLGMSTTEARLLGHRLLATAEQADLEAAALRASLATPRRRRLRAA